MNMVASLLLMLIYECTNISGYIHVIQHNEYTCLSYGHGLNGHARSILLVITI